MWKQAAGADDRVASVGAEGSGAGTPPPCCAGLVPLLRLEVMTACRVLLAAGAGPQRVRKARRTTTIT
jgi:hypothetical protein